MLLISLPMNGQKQPVSAALNLAEEFEETHLQVKLINATILVADWKNFSALMEEFAHDPSTVMQAASNIFSQLNKEIEKNQGQLEKIAGDAIMAYWAQGGSDTVAKTSCNKACLTAIRLKETIVKIAKDKNIWPF